MVRRQFIYDYNGKQIDYSVWFTSDEQAIDTIVFLGTVQIDKLPEWVAESCPPRTAVVQGAPHWYAREDGSDIPDFMLNYTKSAFGVIADSYKFDSVDIIAESQAAPCVVQLLTLDEYSARLKSLVLLQPLGFNSSAFEGTDERRLELFRKRIIRNAYHQLTALLLDSRLRYNHRLLGRRVKLSEPRSRCQYNSGLKHDALPDLGQLFSLNDQITIICGSKDRMFPAAEIKANLRQLDLPIPVRVVAGIPHSPAASKQGTKLIKAAFSELNL